VVAESRSARNAGAIAVNDSYRESQAIGDTQIAAFIAYAVKEGVLDIRYNNHSQRGLAQEHSTGSNKGGGAVKKL
jgi:hypothetical protein